MKGYLLENVNPIIFFFCWTQTLILVLFYFQNRYSSERILSLWKKCIFFINENYYWKIKYLNPSQKNGEIPCPFFHFDLISRWFTTLLTGIWRAKNPTANNVHQTNPIIKAKPTVNTIGILLPAFPFSLPASPNLKYP